MKAFADQIAVVTGASSDIGKAIALDLAEQGAALCLIARDAQRLNAAAVAAQQATGVVQSFQIDLTVDESIRSLAEQLEKDFRGIDVLVHSSGVIHRGEHQSASVQELDLQYRANVRAPYLLTQALLPLLKSRKGQIVFINSTQGMNASAGSGQFAATQHALKAMADSLREEVNADGIRVLSVYPGRTATPRTERIFAMEGKAFHPELLLQPKDVACVVINALAAPRTAEVTNISIRPMLKTY